MRKKVIVAGGSGFIGSRLVPVLDRAGYEVVQLSRRSGPNIVVWDARTVGEWAETLRDAHAVINLTGETINQRWTPAAKEKIVGSRVDAVRAIGNAKRQVGGPPLRWINASAIGFYGDGGATHFDESSPQGTGFVAETCGAWEDAFLLASHGHIATRIRIGIVLGAEGGALPVIARLAKLGLGGTIGDGQQGMSWIDREDLIRLFQWVLESDSPPPVVNGVAPNPVSNREFMATLRKVVGVPFGIPAPTFGVRLATSLIGTAPELVTDGNYVVPRVASEGGFVFTSPLLEATLQRIVG